jgi:uncharacterized protein (DUF302 family)
MRYLVSAIMSLFFFVSPAIAGDGLINSKSPHDVKRTADRLEDAVKKKGMTVFIRINHAESAQKAGKELRPTELLIFGNPKVGAPLMLCGQRVGIDLPQKALIWEDEAGQVWLSYNDPKYLVRRHGILGCAEVIEKIGKALGGFANEATMP